MAGPQNVKVTLKWYVTTRDPGEQDCFIAAEREMELPFMPFVGLEIFFLVRAEDDRLASPEHPGKRELRFVVGALEYWPDSGRIVLGDLSHDLGGEPSSHPRDLWIAWLEDAGFSVRDEAWLDGRPARLRSVPASDDG